MFASAHKIDNIISAIDYNHQQIDGRVEDVISLGDLKAKWEAFGWLVFECDGNNIDDILNTVSQAKQHLFMEKPIMLLLNTKMGYGVDFMLDDCKWHGTAPNAEHLKMALEQLPETLGDY